ncbi:hypothetical protein GL213_08185 [Halogeometricum borinquense]|uniref:DUF8142 domain-containing protein n=2 Tax=Halogeometricum borinquense TaxID=60847 RepID=E4NLK8_HALBP|nr:hypothetical protein [Halogeometricum borinquense]ADQ67211.1 hypothetical protein Hbor_16410 [Halogeometricum borinquense DSM 11551]ELY29758.1 hypothetical protein C499_05623 [Halogeometricum borinquense DSM 11551]QIB74554.1 hypothetical protein G3I44_09825 [Halogeometricum borinquense]QIQ76501.1 hypothetical protein GL213_08185 [Halogeometricum borinquense]RYJ13836.1 hypothetical protein ELS19_07570 [Halogeometricum borinquense]
MRSSATTSADDEAEDAPVEGEFDPDSPLQPDAGGRNRKRAVLAVLPFLSIGLLTVVFLLQWGLEPLWAFAILPPILFCSLLAYMVFSTDFLEDRT